MTIRASRYDYMSVLNLQRAVQASIDLAHVVIAKYGLGLPSDYSQTFTILARQRIIDEL